MQLRIPDVKFKAAHNCAVIAVFTVKNALSIDKWYLCTMKTGVFPIKKKYLTLKQTFTLVVH
jgi:hypothetical protein